MFDKNRQKPVSARMV